MIRPMRRSAAASLALVAVMALSACGKKDVPADSPSLPKLETYTVSTADAEAGRSWDGVVEAVRTAVLSAQTGGRIQAVDVDVNDRVSAGQTLLRLTVVEQQAAVDAARAQLRAAEASAIEAERTYQRFASLVERDYVSRAQFDQTRAARDAANAARDAARAQLSSAGQNADYTTVRAPYAGIVAMRNVEPGETVAPGQALLTMYAPEDLRMEVRVPQSDAEAIRALSTARVHFDNGIAVNARQIVVYPGADPASHSVLVRVLLPRMDTPVSPGTTAKVMFPVTGDGQVLRVPTSAVSRRGELTGVYVLKGNTLGLRQVRLGRVAGTSVDVIAGLRSGEVIVTDPDAALQALLRQREAAGAGHG